MSWVAIRLFISPPFPGRATAGVSSDGAILPPGRSLALSLAAAGASGARRLQAGGAKRHIKFTAE